MDTLTEDTAERLYKYSVKNRMPTSFLEKIAGLRGFEAFSRLFDREQVTYISMLDAVSEVSDCLSKANVDHAIFKTIRPYKSTTVDIDTVIFGDKDDYLKSMKAMKAANYQMLADGPMSATFWDKKADIGVDLYNEIAVSALCYIDKERLATFAQKIWLPNGRNANLLAPEADLLAIVAHSIIKEQMYTLSEYYSFAKYLESIDTTRFIDLVRKSNLTNAVKTHASITAMLLRATRGKIPKKLEVILGDFGRDNFELSRIMRNSLRTPHKYHPITVGKSLLEITKSQKPRSSIALQIYSMTSPSFTKKFLKALLQHVTRETY